MVCVITSKATKKQIQQMQHLFEHHVKLAVDIRKEILSGGGFTHMQCKSKLLDCGSCAEDIWGIFWEPDTGEIEFKSAINVRLQKGYKTNIIKDADIKEKIIKVVRKLLK